MMTPLLLAVHLLSAPPEKQPAYPNPNLLVDPAELVTAAGREKFRILDVRTRDKYDAGHIPGAVPAPLAAWSTAVAGGTADAAFWKKELAAAGVTPGNPAVVYGDDMRDSCRAWWVLKYAGVSDARVFNGKWDAALQAKTGVEKGAPPAVAAAPHDWKPDPARLATKADVLAEIKNPSGAVVDARSPGEFTGRQKTAKRAGCVPGAVNLEWSDFLDPETGAFLPPDALTKLAADRKLDLSKPAVTYCQSGGRASVAAFGLELLGAKGVRNYYRSWSEWGNADDTPVQAPPKK